MDEKSVLLEIIIEKIKETDDLGLLDLIYKLLITK